MKQCDNVNIEIIANLLYSSTMNFNYEIAFMISEAMHNLVSTKLKIVLDYE